MTNATTKKARVISYLSRGKGLTVNEARSRFGVQNLRAMMSDIRNSSNWRVDTEETTRGNNRYYIRKA